MHKSCLWYMRNSQICSTVWQHHPCSHRRVKLKSIIRGRLVWYSHPFVSYTSVYLSCSALTLTGKKASEQCNLSGGVCWGDLQRTNYWCFFEDWNPISTAEQREVEAVIHVVLGIVIWKCFCFGVRQATHKWRRPLISGFLPKFLFPQKYFSSSEACRKARGHVSLWYLTLGAGPWTSTYIRATAYLYYTEQLFWIHVEDIRTTPPFILKCLFTDFPL